MSQDWNSLTTYFVRELGTPDSSALPISLSNVSKTKAELDSKIQAAFKTDAPVKSILRADNSRVDSDLGVVFLSEGTTLDVEFANKVSFLSVSPLPLLIAFHSVSPLPLLIVSSTGLFGTLSVSCGFRSFVPMPTMPLFSVGSKRRKSSCNQASP